MLQGLPDCRIQPESLHRINRMPFVILVQHEIRIDKPDNQPVWLSGIQFPCHGISQKIPVFLNLAGWIKMQLSGFDHPAIPPVKRKAGGVNSSCKMCWHETIDRPLESDAHDCL